MSVEVTNVGGSMSGGVSKTLVFAGSPVAGKMSYQVSGSTVIAPRKVDFTVTQPAISSATAGQLKAGIKTQASNRTSEEGCCTATVGFIKAETAFAWDLSQDAALFDELYDLHVATLAMSSTRERIKQGLLPQP